MDFKRGSGILMPIASLPSPYGIGTLGKSAYDFVDFLKASGQSWWQILPVGPLSYGDSPYQSFSTFAGNPYFVDLDLLIKDGLISEEDIAGIDWGTKEDEIDYGKIYNARFEILRKATDVGLKRDEKNVERFVSENSLWLPNYALFMAVKRHFGMKLWTDWPDKDIRLHKETACEKYRKMLKSDIDLFIYIQYLFYKQWDELKEYASKVGIGIIGDIPIYVAMDSADVWAEPFWFQLNEDNIPVEVSGVPPDSFNEDGQLWGNPLYRWDAMKEDGFSWWVRRIKGAFRLYDVIRFDHFRGLESYYAVPYGESNAKKGHWVKGPGKDLIAVLHKEFSDKSFIAEDLGYLSPEVIDMLAYSGYPGMRILEFAFELELEGSPYYLPHNYPVNSICYTGTHDNQTVIGWLKSASPKDADMAKRYLYLNEQEGANWGFIRVGMSSVSSLFIAQIQDYLGLGNEARINLPGTSGTNWKWRVRKEQLTDALSKKILDMTHLYGRI